LPFFKTPFSFLGKKPFVKFFGLPLPADGHAPERFFTRENAALSIIEFFQIKLNGKWGNEEVTGSYGLQAGEKDSKLK
jgi:hypothetical protein